MIVQHLVAFIGDGPTAWPLLALRISTTLVADLVLLPGRNLIHTARLLAKTDVC